MRRSQSIAWNTTKIRVIYDVIRAAFPSTNGEREPMPRLRSFVCDSRDPGGAQGQFDCLFDYTSQHHAVSFSPTFIIWTPTLQTNKKVSWLPVNETPIIIQRCTVEATPYRKRDRLRHPNFNKKQDGTPCFCIRDWTSAWISQSITVNAV